ncbi:hypothetical protein VTO42DRAFT_1319 [Malbranchea cinnamomea]
MPAFFSSSSSGSAFSTRPTRLHTQSKRKRYDGFPPWSWSPRDLRRQVLHTTRTRSRKSTRKNEQADGSVDSSHRRTASSALKGALKTLGRAGHQKSVTIEEPHGTGRGVATSDEGTVRRRNRDGLPSSRGLVDDDDEESWVKVGHHAGAHYGQYLEVPSRKAEKELPGVSVSKTEKEPKERRHIRTVSHDDYLTVRGANPRTGVVSPSITSSSSRRSHDQDRRGEKNKRHPSRKWRLKGNQWVSIEADEGTPLASPNADEDRRRQSHDPTAEERAQTYINLLTESGVPMSKLEDKFVVNMPSATEPSPPTMTTQQILDFQQAIERHRRHGGHLVDPNSPPTPRVETLERPSTPPRRLARKFPPNFMGREKRWSHGPPGDEKGKQRAVEAGEQEHVHVEQFPDTSQPHRDAHPRAGRPVNQSAGDTAPHPFLGVRMARGNQEHHLFQSIDAIVSQSPPSTKDTPTSEEREEQRVVEVSMRPNENRPGNSTSHGSLLQRRKLTNAQKLAVEKPMRIRIFEPFRKGDVCTTITTTSTTLRQKPLLQFDFDHAAGRGCMEVTRGQDCVFPSSFPFLPEDHGVHRKVEDITVQVKDTGERVIPRDTENQREVYTNTGFTSTLSVLSGRTQSIDTSDDSYATPEEKIQHSQEEAAARDSTIAYSLSPSRLVFDEQPTLGQFGIRLHQILVAIVLLILDFGSYLCDTGRSYLRSDVVRSVTAGTVGPMDDSLFFQTVRHPRATMISRWLSVLFDLAVTFVVIFVTSSALTFMDDVEGWTFLVVAMAT